LKSVLFVLWLPVRVSSFSSQLWLIPVMRLIATVRSNSIIVSYAVSVLSVNWNWIMLLLLLPVNLIKAGDLIWCSVVARYIT